MKKPRHEHSPFFITGKTVKHQGPGQPQAADEVDRVIELDSEAVGFVVSEQWTMMTDADRRLDAFLTHLLDGQAARRRKRS